MHDDLKRQQEMQHDGDALARFDDEGGCQYPSVDADGESLLLPLHRMSETDMAAVAQQVAAGTVVNEIRALKAELDATPLSRAYRRLRNAATGKEVRQARSAIRRSVRQQMVNTMKSNSPDLCARPQIAMAIAATVVRAQMSSSHD